MDWKQFPVILHKFELKYFIASVLFCASLYFLSGIEIKYILNKLSKIKISISDVFLLPLTSALFGYLLPVKGGLIFQTFFLKKKYNVTLKTNFSIALISYAFFAIIYGGAGLIYSLLMEKNELVFLIAFLMVAAPFIAFLAYSLLYKKYFSVGVKNKIITNFNEIYIEIKTVIKRSDFLASMFTISLMRIVLRIFWYSIILKGIGFDNVFYISILLSLGCEVAALVNFIPGNIGVNEFFSSVLVTTLGYSAANGLFVELIMRFSALLLIMVGGTIGLMINKNELKFSVSGLIKNFYERKRV